MDISLKMVTSKTGGNMRKCIMGNCNKKVQDESGNLGIDPMFYCKKHKEEVREKLVKESRDMIRKIARKLI